MSIRSRIRTWWKAIRQSEHFNQEIEEELAFHIEEYAADLEQNGLTRDEALRRARAELGGIASQKENCRAAWGTRLWDELVGDLRFAWRMLAKSPAFTAIAIGSLALGIGANTVIFTFAKQTLLDKLAVPNPDELRLLGWYDSGKNGAVHWAWGDNWVTPSGRQMNTYFSYPVYLLLRHNNHVLQDIFAFKDYGTVTATIDGQAEALVGEMVSGNYYQALEVRPALGRLIEEPDDLVPGTGAVAVISDGYWARRFGRSPSIIGKTILLNLTPFTIIGVNPPGFTGTTQVQNSPDIFFPFSMQPVSFSLHSNTLLADGDKWWVTVMARSKPGTNEASALSSLDVVLDNAVRATMTVDKDASLPRLEWIEGNRGLNWSGRELSKPIYVLLALTGSVLLLACANLANLLLARSSSRQREIGVRIALGARRSRILRQMLTESLMLSCLGGTAGLFLGYLGRNALPSLLSSRGAPIPASGHFDWQIFSFAVVISLVTGFIFGLAPAWQAASTEANATLKDSAQTITRRRKALAGKALVIVQVSLSVILVVVAGLFTRTLFNLGKTDLGFRPENVLLFHIQQPKTRYPESKDIALHRQIEEKLATVPGVESVSLSQIPMIAGGEWSTNFHLDGRMEKSQKDLLVRVNSVGSHFFSTMGIPLISGRSLTFADTASSKKVAVINQQLARKFFPNTNPIGRTFITGKDEPLTEIVGIVKDAHYSSVRKEPPALVYLPYQQQKNVEDGLTYEVRTKLKPEAIVPSLRVAVQSIDKDLPLTDIRTQQQQIDETVAQEKTFASLSSGFGILALILACIGIYGLMAYTVARRTNEIGIRMALGAQPANMLRMVLGEAFWLTMIGILVGVAASLGLGRMIATMLYGLKPTDSQTLISSAALLCLVALTASWIPARRAARTDPMIALRHE